MHISFTNPPFSLEASPKNSARAREVHQLTSQMLFVNKWQNTAGPSDAETCLSDSSVYIEITIHWEWCMGCSGNFLSQHTHLLSVGFQILFTTLERSSWHYMHYSSSCMYLWALIERLTGKSSQTGSVSLGNPSSLMEVEEQFILHNQYFDYWWPNEARSQTISIGHGNGLKTYVPSRFPKATHHILTVSLTLFIWWCHTRSFSAL